VARVNKNYKIEKQKLDYFDLLKSVTNFINNVNNRNYKFIESKIEKHNCNNSYWIFSQLLSYCYNKLYAIWYINKYLNNRFDFYRTESNKNWKGLFRSIISIMTIQKLPKQLSFIKSRENRDTNKKPVKQVISKYFQLIHNKELNIDEINFYYKLFLSGVITPEDIYELNEKIQGDKININLNLLIKTMDSQESIDDYVARSVEQKNAPKINEFILELKTIKENSEECQKCPLKDQKMVPFETNMIEYGTVDICFIGLNPGQDESIYNKLMVGPSGKLVRQKMYFLPTQTKWAITNIIMCHTTNQDILNKKCKNISKNCMSILGEIFNKFPAHYYVVFGSQACKLFGITDSVMKISGSLVQLSSGANIIPIIHPSAILHQKSTPFMQKSWNIGWDSIYKIINNHLGVKLPSVRENKPVKTSEAKTTQSNNTNTNSLININPARIIENPDKTMSLFDVVNINNKDIVMIFIDSDGIKWYQIKPYTQEIFIKNSTWDNCNMVVSDIDDNCVINGYQKYKLSKLLYDIIEINKRNICVGK
jgi:uracil-DNA glycosylase family 4